MSTVAWTTTLGNEPVRIPMMPKGVEHTDIFAPWYPDAWVRIPMMPKGVEHMVIGSINFSGGIVRIPMMPKGVEHSGERAGTFGALECEFR